ncbi:MAG: hypothetical protein AB1412_11295 [Pseudomonadota bacterium]
MAPFSQSKEPPQKPGRFTRQIDRALRQSSLEPLIAKRVASFDLMMTLGRLEKPGGLAAVRT